MSNNYIVFKKLSEKYFEKFKENYQNKINLAIESKRTVVHYQFLDILINVEKIKLESELGQKFRIIYELEEEFGVDSSLSKEDIFNLKIEKYPKKEHKKLIENLAKYDSIIKLYDCISKDSMYALKTLESNKLPQNTSGIRWKEGATQVDFIQLVYALHESGLLRNEKQQVTKLVEDIAVLFNFKLGNNWQKNYSDNKNNRNHGYEIKIFSELEKSYKNYLIRTLKKTKNGK
jgi:hypothetical protein